jgi:dsRNA-specific ribonuclease
LKGGYPFNQDKAWRRQLVQIGTTLYCEHEIINRLEAGWLQLMGNIYGLPSFERHRLLMEKQKSKILLLCSLFNDSLSNLSDAGSFRRMDTSFTSASVSTLESDTSSNVDSSATPESGLIRIALLRDTLFMVGHSGLQLAITDELFKLYPDATEGDLSLQRSCATSDDVMAYVMVKSGLNQSLYHQNTSSEKHFTSEMSAAEDLGRKIWNRRNGWILKGGKQEYIRRCATLSFLMPQGLPCYCGLAAGRLHGHKSKLPDRLTEDLVFSMKSIAGALVLSLGLEGMWQSLGPLFGELLLLSADELKKEYRMNSSIIKTT